ncbi:UNVERIFIED_ORG: putative transcriptional regulator [Rhodococcus erythropolis]
MSTESELPRDGAAEIWRYREDAWRIRDEIISTLSTMAATRKQALKAEAAVRKSKNTVVEKINRAEADRLANAANDAEKKYLDLERDLADVELKATLLERELEQARPSDSEILERKWVALRRVAKDAASQFPSSLVTHVGAKREVAPQNLVCDVFLSHASEDKDEVARPLKDALEAIGVSVWFDEIQIKVGHSIRQSIEKGIQDCRFGVVIISPNFFAKQWTNAELDALFGKKMGTGEDLVLPVWHHVSKDEVTRNSPLLAGILALNTATMTVDEIASALAEVVRG